ncbi:hypothetical protein EDB83DRAFT_2315985 [Lactarius deliciosus]|nr:hypothetical protein EDB83DRAFT_2315985 [Lactarius deliciosus]
MPSLRHHGRHAIVTPLVVVVVVIVVPASPCHVVMWGSHRSGGGGGGGGNLQSKSRWHRWWHRWGWWHRLHTHHHCTRTTHWHAIHHDVIALSLAPPMLGFGPHASLWPPPPTHCNAVQELLQRHPHMACNPCRYDATNDDSNQVDDDGDTVGDSSSDGGGDTEGNGSSDAEGNGDSDAEGNDGGDAAAGMTWRWE